MVSTLEHIRAGVPCDEKIVDVHSARVSKRDRIRKTSTRGIESGAVFAALGSAGTQVPDAQFGGIEGPLLIRRPPEGVDDAPACREGVVSASGHDGAGTCDIQHKADGLRVRTLWKKRLTEEDTRNLNYDWFHLINLSKISARLLSSLIRVFPKEDTRNLNYDWSRNLNYDCFL